MPRHIMIWTIFILHRFIFNWGMDIGTAYSFEINMVSKSLSEGWTEITHRYFEIPWCEAFILIFRGNVPPWYSIENDRKQNEELRGVIHSKICGRDFFFTLLTFFLTFWLFWLFFWFFWLFLTFFDFFDFFDFFWHFWHFWLYWLLAPNRGICMEKNGFAYKNRRGPK